MFGHLKQRAPTLPKQEPVRRVLALLSPQARGLLLCTNAGHSTGELAAALECSDTAIRLRLFRARRQLREALYEDAVDMGYVRARAHRRRTKAPRLRRSAGR